MTEETRFVPRTYLDGKGVFHLFPSLCKGCGLCIEKCPVGALGWSQETGFLGTPSVQPVRAYCTACRTCELVCPDCAIFVEKMARAGKSPQKPTGEAPN